MSILANSARLDIVWRRLGLIPCSPASSSSSPGVQEEMALVQEMVQEKATALLDQPNLALLMFHLQQYRERRLSVQKLIQLLMSMFDTQVGTSPLSLLTNLTYIYKLSQVTILASSYSPLQAQESLFTEIDELIFSEDLDIYNRMVFQKGQLFERFLLNQPGLAGKCQSNSESVCLDYKSSPAFSYSRFEDSCYDESTGLSRINYISCYLIFIFFYISLHPESGKGSEVSSVILLSSPQHFNSQSARSFDLDDPGPGERSGIPRKVNVC